jgi:hypothetical protein
MPKSATLARSPAPQRKVLERTRALYAAGAALPPLDAERDVRDAMQTYFAAFAAKTAGEEVDVEAAKARLHAVLAAAETEYAQALQRARRR